MLRATCFHVATRIVEAADACSAAAIVVGSRRRRRRRLRRLGGHGIRERVTRLSALPVLSAPLQLSGRAHLDVDALLAEVLSGSTLTG